jgi:hypothetical protein
MASEANEGRLQIIQILLEHSPPEKERDALIFAQTIIQAVSAFVKKKYLLESAGAFDLLEEWFPGDSDKILNVLAAGVKYKGTSAKAFYKAFLVVVSEDGLEDSVSNPSSGV